MVRPIDLKKAEGMKNDGKETEASVTSETGSTENDRDSRQHNPKQARATAVEEFIRFSKAARRRWQKEEVSELDDSYAFAFELRKTFELDEWQYRNFCANAMFALIGANWIAMDKFTAGLPAKASFMLSIVLAITYLHLRGLRQHLNSKHNRQILEVSYKAAVANSQRRS
jgi:hypothetical protein